jgi:predicted enzyme related to lactoylglutathione lyase
MAGKVVHVEIGAADADRAQGFWSGVFGWEVGPPMLPEMDYRMFQSADDQGGAILASEEQGSLTVYFDTDDIDASLAKVRELGGEAGDKTPVPGHGWFAACRDTEGNAFSLWQGDESAA